MPELNVIIIGAGIAGLTTAIALRRYNYNVTILEKTRPFHYSGGATVLAPNATRVLIEYNLRQMLEPLCIPIQALNVRRWKNGDIISSSKLQETQECYGYPTWVILQRDLHLALYKAATNRGARICLGCWVLIEAFDPQRRVLTLKNGTVVPADLVIGADGICSKTRKLMLEDGGVDINTPYTTYCMTMPYHELAGDNGLVYLTYDVNTWLGPDGIITTINAGCRELTMVFQTLGEKKEKCRLKNNQILDKLKRDFFEFDPRITRLLGRAKGKNWFTWQVYDLPRLRKWSNESGTAVVVGDAAQAILPAGGQGIAQAVEDSACFALCLDRLKSVPEAVRAFETIRRPRKEWMSHRSWVDTEMSFLKDGLLQQKRDAFLKRIKILTPKEWDGKHVDEPPEGDYHHPLAIPYQQGYNVFDHTKRRLAVIEFMSSLNKLSIGDKRDTENSERGKAGRKRTSSI